MVFYVYIPVYSVNPYLRHLTQYFVEKHTIIWAEAHSISDWGSARWNAAKGDPPEEDSTG